MPIALERKLIQAHIPKTGGTTVSSALGISETVEHYIYTRAIPGLGDGRTPQHFTLAQIRDLLGGEVFNQCLRFGFIRNPWDRFVSEFIWRKRLMERTPMPGTVYHAKHFESLDTFARCLEIEREKRISCAFGFDAHLEPQVDFLRDPQTKEMLVQFIGRFERFAHDVEALGVFVGQPISGIPHLRKSPRARDYRTYYSALSKQAVSRFYAEDLEFGEYVF